MNPILAVLAAVVVVIIAAVVARLLGLVIVHDYERGLRYSRGRLMGRG